VLDTIDKMLELLKNKGKTQKGLADFIKISAPNLNKILKRDPSSNRKLSANHLLLSAQYFGVDETYFSLHSDKKPVSTIKVVGTASCGSLEENHLQEDRVCLYNGDNFKDTLYCVVANGDSMSPEIEDGDEIICDPDMEVKSGDIVHYRIGNESAVKVYLYDDDAYMVQFIPYNSTDIFKTKTIRIDDDEMNELKVSKVVAINKLKFNNRRSRLKMIGRS